MKTFRISLLFVAGLIGLASCTKDGHDNYLEDSSWVAKIDVNEQHYWVINFTDDDFYINIVDSNRMPVHSEFYGKYSFSNGEISLYDVKPREIELEYKPNDGTIYCSWFGQNFIRQ